MPNPFNPTTTIHLSLQASAWISVAVFDIAGRNIKNLHNATMQAGGHKLTWTGLNETGKAMPAGVYNIIVRTSSSILVKKATLLK